MPPFSLVGGSPQSNKAGKHTETSSPASGSEAKPFDITVIVNAAECYIRMTHTFVSGEAIKVMNRAKRDAVFAQVAHIHDKTEWDPASRKMGPNPLFKPKYSGLCSVDPDGMIITGVHEFSDYIQDNIIKPHARLWDSVTYFIKKTSTSVPDKYDSFDKFDAAIKEMRFAYACPDVLTRLRNIEEHLLKEP